MPFKKGQVKTGGSGRKAGAITQANRALTACESLGVDPFAILAEFAKTSTDKRLRFDAAKELAQYILPKLKATELSTGAEGLKMVWELGNYTPEKK